MYLLRIMVQRKAHYKKVSLRFFLRKDRERGYCFGFLHETST